MLWAYLAFGQLLIIWSGNLPHEISWYLHRVNDGWRWVAVFIVLFHFLRSLLSASLATGKTTPARPGQVAACILAAHIVAIWWTVAPSIFTNIFT